MRDVKLNFTYLNVVVTQSLLILPLELVEKLVINSSIYIYNEIHTSIDDIYFNIYDYVKKENQMSKKNSKKYLWNRKSLRQRSCQIGHKVSHPRLRELNL